MSEPMTTGDQLYFGIGVFTFVCGLVLAVIGGVRCDDIPGKVLAAVVGTFVSGIAAMFWPVAWFIAGILGLIFLLSPRRRKGGWPPVSS
jgi:hypothetical protein